MKMKFLVLTAILSFAFSISVSAETVILLGDTGRDNAGQRAVADSIAQTCDGGECSAVFLLGDNVYDRGIKDPQDPLMDRMFRKHYEKLKIPFQVILGNHDNGRWSNDWERGRAQVLYGKLNPQFVLPSEYYWFETDEMVVAALDTSRLMWKKDQDSQAKVLAEAYSRSQQTGKWFLVMGHHPYVSNGKHGNAGSYDGVSFFGPVSGSDLKKFLDRHVCGKAVMYLSGHDHNLQILDARQRGCDMIQVVSGAGSSVEEWREKNRLHFGALELGYFKMDVSSQVIHLQAINEKNKVLFSFKKNR